MVTFLSHLMVIVFDVPATMCLECGAPSVLVAFIPF